MKAFYSVVSFVLLCSISNAQSFEKFFGSIDATKKVMDVSLTSDNNFIVGLIDDADSGRPIIAKMDEFNNVLWSKKVNLTGSTSSGSDPCFTIQESDQGGFLFFTSVDGSNGSLLMKLDASGNEEWNLVQNYTAAGYWAPNSHAMELPGGDIVMFKSYWGSMFYSRISPTGTVLWSKTLSEDSLCTGKNPGFDFTCLSDGSIICSGKSENDNCFAHIDGSGNMLWNKIHVLDAGIYNQPRAITNMDDGNVMAGGLRGGSTGFIMKLDAITGAILWDKNISDMVVEDIVPMGDNKYILFGGDKLYLVDQYGDVLESVQFTIPFGVMQKRAFKKFAGETYLSYYVNSSSTQSVGLIKMNSLLSHPCIAQDNAFGATVASGFAVSDGGSLYLQNNGMFTTASLMITNFPSSSLYLVSSDMCALTSVTENKTVLVNVYPNPTGNSDVINVEMSNDASYVINLTDATGRIVSTRSFNGNKTLLSTAGWSKGIYILNILDASGNVLSQKFVKE